MLKICKRDTSPSPPYPLLIFASLPNPNRPKKTGFHLTCKFGLWNTKRFPQWGHQYRLWKLNPISFKTSSVKIWSGAADQEGQNSSAHVARGSWAGLDAVHLKWNGLLKLIPMPYWRNPGMMKIQYSEHHSLTEILVSEQGKSYIIYIFLLSKHAYDDKQYLIRLDHVWYCIKLITFDIKTRCAQ